MYTQNTERTKKYSWTLALLALAGVAAAVISWPKSTASADVVNLEEAPKIMDMDFDEDISEELLAKENAMLEDLKD